MSYMKSFSNSALTNCLTFIQPEVIEHFQLALIQFSQSNIHFSHRFCIPWQVKHQIRLLLTH